MNNRKYSVSVLKKFPNLTAIHHIEPNNTVWATFKRSILRGDGNIWSEVAKFPRCYPRDLFGFSRPTARVMRSDKCNIYVNSSGYILGIRGGTVYEIDLANGLRRLFDIQGDCVLHGGISEDALGWSYIGEYFMNPDRRPVRIWRVSPNLEIFEVAFEFPAKSIRHVHGIYRDPFVPENLWVTVGDLNGECFLGRTSDRFRSLIFFGDGLQSWRAVKLFFTASHVCWLTDSEVTPNRACKMERVSGRMQYGQAIDCSTWYGTTTKEGLHVAFTTVESGPAIKRNESCILVSEDGFSWEEIYSFKKDFYRPIRLFKAGIIFSPSGTITQDNFYISGEGLIGLDGCSLLLKIS
ncbi:MAG: hypothetical protein JRG72_11415 [Deltaproteobacteria bacterium]|nr:hypothetical protein [Deltaproteobacteria bacterium]